MRLTIAAVFAAATIALCGAAASAEPCPVELRYAAETSSPGTFAVGFRALLDGVAELRLTLYATDGTTYEAELPKITLARPAVSDDVVLKMWVSDPSYVRLPPQAAPLEAATLDVIDPDTHGAVICSGNHSRWLNVDPRKSGPNRTPPRVDAERISDLTRALQAFSPASSIVAANPLPTVGKPDCAKPYIDAKAKEIWQAGYPARARVMGDTGATAVMVDLDETGKLNGTVLYERSGSSDLDEAARGAAERTTYAPEIFRCAPVSGLYLFRVDFAH